MRLNFVYIGYGDGDGDTENGNGDTVYETKFISSLTQL